MCVEIGKMSPSCAFILDRWTTTSSHTEKLLLALAVTTPKGVINYQPSCQQTRFLFVLDTVSAFVMCKGNCIQDINLVRIAATRHMQLTSLCLLPLKSPEDFSLTLSKPVSGHERQVFPFNDLSLHFHFMEKQS